MLRSFGLIDSSELSCQIKIYLYLHIISATSRELYLVILYHTVALHCSLVVLPSLVPTALLPDQDIPMLYLHIIFQSQRLSCQINWPGAMYVFDVCIRCMCLMLYAFSPARSIGQVPISICARGCSSLPC